MHRRLAVYCYWLALAGSSVGAFGSLAAQEAPLQTLSLIVMDPLAAPLSCPCVEGYAQRKYEVLADRLQDAMGCPVQLSFGESLRMALKKSDGKADLIIGKDSVVRADAAANGRTVTPIGALSDKQGSTTQHGLIVVNHADPAQSVNDLHGYSIVFGPAEADEKHAAVFSLLSKVGVSVPENPTISSACSDGACQVIDSGPQSKSAAVISSYAAPLLEGCGTVKKGDLRVVAKTDPVPFIAAFTTDSVSPDQRALLQNVLFDLVNDSEAMEALESLAGFLPMAEEASVEAAKRKKKE
ncbi:PhnD/SsuA/transferrin family substrate-binding protein [Novipirellula artificiosorum]|uniref:ABC transporter, phosphonate, periplasmic substrate-binding protein n=1 Tax=Novipirellula artificiosorum TaxID=2528016 RepID=A0A5C6D4L3_9BACT|nr:PhnD/SsuA/transferrin family substrate-binding protein [Novipirellula artificiosorum]TWU30864.1 ABC transporter, phosphonate, periplasmic substrate-binding protein [Novipirellula artificiosorum]